MATYGDDLYGIDVYGPEDVPALTGEGDEHLIVTAEVSRRMRRQWIPEFYRANPDFAWLVRFAEDTADAYDYYLAKAVWLPMLVDLRQCPDEFLPNLSALLGYRWDPTLSSALQRRDIEELVAFYKVRGTPQSVTHVVGRTCPAPNPPAGVFVPFEHVFKCDISQLDGGHHLEDGTYWRWGTYQVESTCDPAEYLPGLIQTIHPAGTVVFAAVRIQLTDQPPNLLEEMPVQFVMIIVTDSDGNPLHEYLDAPIDDLLYGPGVGLGLHGSFLAIQHGHGADAIERLPVFEAGPFIIAISALASADLLGGTVVAIDIDAVRVWRLVGGSLIPV